jgi:hypothetical protein
MLSRSDVARMLAHSDEDLDRDVDAALTAVGLRDWWVEVHDGIVDLVAPAGDQPFELARIVAETVPGAITVRVRAD